MHASTQALSAQRGANHRGLLARQENEDTVKAKSREQPGLEELGQGVIRQHI